MPLDRAHRLAPLEQLTPGTLLIHEIYVSIQGESSYAGRPCVFVRTTACNLRCHYCDTSHAFFDGTLMATLRVVEEVERFGLRLVEITGGEPLLQPEVFPLMRTLCDAGYEVLLETSGALDVGSVDPRVVKIVDIKTPGSGEAASNRYENLELLTGRDEVKLVLTSRQDYEWAKSQIREHTLAERCHVLLGAAFGRLEPRQLAEWIIADRLPVRLQLQLHKYLWDPRARGV